MVAEITMMAGVVITVTVMVDGTMDTIALLAGS